MAFAGLPGELRSSGLSSSARDPPTTDAAGNPGRSSGI